MRSFISPDSGIQRQISPWTSKPEPCSKDQGLLGWVRTPTPHAPQGAQTQPVHPSNGFSGENSSRTYSFNRAEREESDQTRFPLTCNGKKCIFRSNMQETTYNCCQCNSNNSQSPCCVFPYNPQTTPICNQNTEGRR